MFATHCLNVWLSKLCKNAKVYEATERERKEKDFSIKKEGARKKGF